MSLIEQNVGALIKRTARATNKKLAAPSPTMAQGFNPASNGGMRLVNNDKMANFAIKMITTQLRYQTPLDPVDSKSMLESFLQMFSMEAMSSIKNSFDNWNKKQESDPLQKASNLLDKRIIYNDNRLQIDREASEDPNSVAKQSALIFADDNIDMNQKMELEIYNDTNEMVAKKQIALKNTGYSAVELYDAARESLPSGHYTMKMSGLNKRGEKVDMPLLKTGNIAQVSRDNAVNDEQGNDGNTGFILHMDSGAQITDFTQIWAIEKQAAAHEKRGEAAAMAAR